jgi:branched-chain amino acid transport system ATP-binding protein
VILGEPILSVLRLSKRFGGIVALKDVSFDVQRGEIVGLMGPNGAGKTTLLNIIAGELTPDSGTIRFKGHDITGHPSHRSCSLGISRAFQIPQPFVSLSVLDNLRVSAIFGRRASATFTGIHTDKILQMAGLLDKKTTLAGELPIISLKKLELARALACDPELILLDEVAAGLTEPEIPKTVTTIREMRAMGKTIILVEHVMKVMMSAVDRIVVLDKGMTICKGTTDEVMNDSKVIEAYFGT